MAKAWTTALRWASDLAQFDFDIKFRSSQQNQLAGGLSRYPVEDEQKMTEVEVEELFQAVISSTAVPVEILLKSQNVALEKEQPVAMATFPAYSPMELRKFQREDKHLGRLWMFWDKGVKTQKNEIKKESYVVRKLLY